MSWKIEHHIETFTGADCIAVSQYNSLKQSGFYLRVYERVLKQKYANHIGVWKIKN